MRVYLVIEGFMYEGLDVGENTCAFTTREMAEAYRKELEGTSRYGGDWEVYEIRLEGLVNGATV